MEKTLKTIIKRPVRIIGAGRTDSGVHASGQVIAFDLEWSHQLEALQKALNVNLPQDVAVVSLTTTDSNFHPRFDALSRQYRYTILNQPVRDVLRRRYTMLVRQPLNLSIMQEAGQLFLGQQDFASFGRPPQGDNTVRTITQIDWAVSGAEIKFEITANAFLYRMVRNIVGTLIQVGLGNLTPAEVEAILLARDRSQGAVPALPSGLCLVKVNYA